MIHIIRKLYQWEVFRYLLFGALTVMVNLTCFYIFSEWLIWGTNFSNICSIILALLFAYITNAKFVFSHDTSAPVNHFLQFRKFIGMRSITLGVEVVGVWVFADVLMFDSMFVKLFLQVIVVVLNYIFSKLIVFL